MTEQNLKQKVVDFFTNLTIEQIDLVDGFYAKNCEFNDPVVHLLGAEAVKKYYAGMYQNVTQIRFEFADISVSGQTVDAPWIMHLTAPKLKKDGAIVVPGLSHIIFNDSGQVAYHRDYFDMGAFVYENIPLIGPIIRFIKRRLHP